MQRGTYISGLGHGGFILWALLGGFFFSARDPMPVQSSDVSLISNEQFAALTMPDLAPEPVQPEPPEISDTPPEATPEPVQAQPAPVPDANPELPDATPDAPPKPAAAPRIAPVAAPAPPPDAEVAETATPEVVPDEGAETPAEEAPATAPQEAATEIVTEAEQPAAAPDASPRPTSRPTPPVQVAEEAPETPDSEPEPEPEPEPDPVADALAEAVQTPDPTAAGPTGPPLTQGQTEGFRVAVGSCWNVDSGSAAASVTVTIGFSLDRQGKVKGGSLKFIGSTGGEQAAANAAFEAARRAIIRCGIKGYDLPLEKYDRWKDIEMTFNPEGMRIR